MSRTARAAAHEPLDEVHRTMPHEARRSLRRAVAELARDRRGNSDLSVYLLLTAAGCVMVGLTAPHLYNASKTASNTFERQVEVLERGASPGGSGGLGSMGGASGGAGGWNLSVGPGGVTASGFGASVSAGGGGASVSVAQGGASVRVAQGGAGGVTVTGGGGALVGSPEEARRASAKLLEAASP